MRTYLTFTVRGVTKNNSNNSHAQHTIAYHFTEY